MKVPSLTPEAMVKFDEMLSDLFDQGKRPLMSKVKLTDVTKEYLAAAMAEAMALGARERGSGVENHYRQASWLAYLLNVPQASRKAMKEAYLLGRRLR